MMRLEQEAKRLLEKNDSFGQNMTSNAPKPGAAINLNKKGKNDSLKKG